MSGLIFAREKVIPTSRGLNRRSTDICQINASTILLRDVEVCRFACCDALLHRRQSRKTMHVLPLVATTLLTFSLSKRALAHRHQHHSNVAARGHTHHDLDKRLLISSLDDPVDVSMSGDHAWRAPGEQDQRGPCPALSTSPDNEAPGYSTDAQGSSPQMHSPTTITSLETVLWGYCLLLLPSMKSTVWVLNWRQS